MYLFLVMLTANSQGPTPLEEKLDGRMMGGGELRKGHDWGGVYMYPWQKKLLFRLSNLKKEKCCLLLDADRENTLRIYF